MGRLCSRGLAGVIGVWTSILFFLFDHSLCCIMGNMRLSLAGLTGIDTHTPGQPQITTPTPRHGNHVTYRGGGECYHYFGVTEVPSPGVVLATLAHL